MKDSLHSLSVSLLCRGCFFFFVVLIVTGCASVQPKAPVRPKVRDLTNGSYYSVKKGDTLYSIGFRSGHGYKRLAAWNKIPPPYNVYIGQKLTLLPRTKAKKNLNSKKQKKKKSRISVNKEKMLKLYWQWPVKGKLLRDFYHTGSKGIDIAGKSGQNIKAAASGVVVYSGSGLVGYGKLIIIKHNYVYLSAYANNRRLLFKEGQKVKKGQIIAEMGVGANAKSSLHFEIRKEGKPVDPIHYLPK